MNLFQNPFYILGATTRDSKQRIIELAKEKSLELDPDVVTEARQILTNPKKRIRAEIAWFHGLSESEERVIMESLKQDELIMINTERLPLLDTLNITIELMDKDFFAEGSLPIIDFVQDLDELFDESTLEKIHLDINSNRIIASIPIVSEISPIKKELQEQVKYYQQKIISILRDKHHRRPAIYMGRLTQYLVDICQSSTFVDEIIDNFYILETKNEIITVSNEIFNNVYNLNLIIDQNIYNRKELSDSARTLRINVRRYLFLTEPIKNNFKLRGLSFETGLTMFNRFRDFIIEYVNHEIRASLLLDQLFIWAKRDTELWDKNQDAIKELLVFTKKKREEKKKYFFEQENFEEIIGLEISWVGLTVYYSKVEVSDSEECEEVEPSEQFTNIETYNITKIISFRHYLTSEDSGTILIDFGIFQKGGLLVTGIEKTNYLKFTNCLWENLGYRLMTLMGNELVLGRNIYGFIYDEGVKLIGNEKHFFNKGVKLINGNEKRFFKWDDVMIYNVTGHCIISSKRNHDFVQRLSYKEHNNIHVIEKMITIVLEKNCEKISEALFIKKEQAIKENQTHFGLIDSAIISKELKFL